MLVRPEMEILQIIRSDSELFEEIVNSMRRIESMGKGYPEEYHRWVASIPETAAREALQGKRGVKGITPGPLDTVAESDEVMTGDRAGKEPVIPLNQGDARKTSGEASMEVDVEVATAEANVGADSENERGQGYSELFGHVATSKALRRRSLGRHGEPAQRGQLDLPGCMFERCCNFGLGLG